ncbi:hypothetical protein ACF0H5_015031 [Mactra antiquata]
MHHQCHLCDRKYAWAHDLKRHFKTKHPMEKYMCKQKQQQKNLTSRSSKKRIPSSSSSSNISPYNSSSMIPIYSSSSSSSKISPYTSNRGNSNLRSNIHLRVSYQDQLPAVKRISCQSYYKAFTQKYNHSHKESFGSTKDGNRCMMSLRRQLCPEWSSLKGYL